MPTDIQIKATEILQRNPGAVVRYRLLRDVLGKPANAPELQEAQERLKYSQCIRELAAEQRPDGGWGAFHSRSTRQKQKTASTEVGVERALALGLDASHPILQRASAYLLDIMQGKRAFPDYHEKNDRWPTGMRLFLASTLSLIQPGHPELDRDRDLWREIARRTFRSGQYRAEDEIQAHAELTGATIKGGYLVLSGRYQLNLLGSLPGTLPVELERAMLEWVWNKPDGIGYLGIALNREPPKPSGHFDRWLASLEMLARLFPASSRFARPSVDWLLAQKNEQGFWDFGPRPVTSSFLPLSNGWRERQNRLFDWTTRILILLRKFSS